MGAACCVASKDKTIRSGSNSESLHRNIRCSPTWSFRWDHRGRVAGEDTSVNWFSDGVSMNDGLENKNESSYASENGSPLQNYQRNRWQKSPTSEGSAGRVINSSSVMPLMKIQPIDIDSQKLKETTTVVQNDAVKPVLKSWLKRLLVFDRQFPNVLKASSSSSEKPVTGEAPQSNNRDGVGTTITEFEPSSVCLAKMMQNFIEESIEKQPLAVKCGRNHCNCFHDNGNDSSNEEPDVFDQSISRNVSVEVSMDQAKELAESSTVSCPSPAKPPCSLPSASLSVSPLSSQSYQPPSSSIPSRWPCHSPRHQLLRQVSDSRILGFKSPSNFCVPEERPVYTSWSNESTMHSNDGSSYNWSMPGISELMGTSCRERWSFDSESFGLNCERSVRPNSQFLTSVDLQTCGVCSKLLTEKSSWCAQKIVASNDLPVVSVLICGHVYHAECLESMTPEINQYDPACPVCTFGVKQTLKLFEIALKAEMDLKVRNKKSSNQIVDSDMDDDSVVFEHFKDGEFQGKSPRMVSSSSGWSSSGKPFLKRHFSFGSKSSKSMLDNHPTRKKGFFWAKSSKK